MLPSSLSRALQSLYLCLGIDKYKMVQCSDALVWELVKNNSSFMKKVNGRTSRSGTVRFSVEKGNVKNISSYKYSGFNSKTVDVSATADNRAALSAKSSKASTQPSKGQPVTPLNKSFHRVEKTITSQIADNFYRPDLKSDALARYSAIYRGNRVAKDVKKGVPVKKGRGKSD